MLLTILALLPLVGGLVVWFLRGSTARYVAIAVALATLVFSLVVAAQYLAHVDLSEHLLWIKAFGAYYALGLDGMGLLMVVLTTILVPVVLAFLQPVSDHVVLAALRAGHVLGRGPARTRRWRTGTTARAGRTPDARPPRR